MSSTLLGSLFSRFRFLLTKRTISKTVPRGTKPKVTLGDPVEHATGLEKRELLAILAGNEDPFDVERIYKRGAGTRNQPNEIPSAFDARLVGCMCEEDSISFNFMWLHKGEPKRCECGHWFTLVHKAPL